MKKSCARGVYWFSVFVGAAGIAAEPTPVGDLLVTERGPNHRKVAYVTAINTAEGGTVLKTNQYTELATGMHYNEAGQWLESKELIEPVEGGAIASHGPHKVEFAANINTSGAIDLLTSDSKRFRSHVIGLAYTDASTGQNVLIAQIKDAVGQLVTQNQILYRDAFDALSADVRYTYTRAGLEQDIILRDVPPPPEAYGFTPQTTRLEVITEFLESPEPQISQRTLSTLDDAALRARAAFPDFNDQMLDFGTMQIGAGQAFPLGTEEEQMELGVPTGKTWQLQDGRRFLIEAVQYSAIQAQIDALLLKRDPGQAKADRKPSPSRFFPPAPMHAKANTERMKTAMLSKQKGFILDYTIVNSGVTNFTFKGDTTYYIPGQGLSLYGTTTIEGGAILKFTNGLSAPQLHFANQIYCKTSPYRPAIFTSMHDDTVGDKILGSSGDPTNYCGYMVYLGNSQGSNYFNVHDLRVLHAAHAFYGTFKVNADISNCQVVHALFGFRNTLAPFFNLRNVLLSKCQYAFEGVTPLTNNAEHVTFYAVSNFMYTTLPAVNLTNSLLIGVTNAVSWVGTSVETNLNPAGIFQSVGSGEFYLATNSPYRDVGTANINPTLLANLRQMTTYPPQMWTGSVFSATTLVQTAVRDTNGLDLGYHYYPIDWLSGSVFVSAPVTLAEGAVLAIGNSTTNNVHVQLNGGAQFLAKGSPLSLSRVTQPETVQEKSATIDASWRPLFDEGTNFTSSTAPVVKFRFAGLSTFQPDRYYFYASSLGSLELGHSQVSGGDLQFGGFNTNAWTKTFVVTNALFERVAMSLGGNDTWFRLHLRNAHAYGGSVSFSPTNASTAWTVMNSCFDGASLWQYASFTNQNNAYISNSSPLLNASNSITLSNLTYDAGQLGSYYQRTNSLVDQGTNTADTFGLYHFTTTTNQVKETNSVVDIGFHYVALNSSGTPQDYDGDGLPDYYEDSNGNGSTDGVETSFIDPDTDYDGRSDGQEVGDGTDPLNAASVSLVRLGYWKFNTTAWSGEEGELPKATTNTQLVVSWSSNAVQINTNTAAFLKYRDQEANAKANINCKAGTVRVWFRPNWASISAGGAGPGNLGTLVALGSYTNTAAYGYWTFACDASGTNLLLITQGGGITTTNTRRAVSMLSNEWHQFVVTYTTTNSAVFLDGVAVATNGVGIQHFPDLPVRMSDGMYVGSNREGNEQAKGHFDELETFNYPLSASQIQSDYLAVINGDGDGDGVPNVTDADPNSSATTAGVTIERPANGQTLH